MSERESKLTRYPSCTILVAVAFVTETIIISAVHRWSFNEDLTRILLGEIVGVVVSGRLSRKLDPELGTTRMELGAPAVVTDGIIEGFIGALLGTSEGTFVGDFVGVLLVTSFGASASVGTKQFCLAP